MRISHIPVTLVFAILWLTGCSGGYYAAFIARSPDDRTEVRVMRNHESFAGDYQFRVDVIAAGKGTTVFEKRTDSMLGLIEIHWSSDGKGMGLLVCDILSGPVWVGYDLTHNRLLDERVFRPALEEQIKRRYSPPKSTDLVRWACSNSGNEAYMNQHTMLPPRL